VSESLIQPHGQLCYVVFLPKVSEAYLPKLLELKFACERVLREVATKHDFTIYELEVNTDHVHLFVGFKPNLSVSYVTQFFKGYSAYPRHLWRGCLFILFLTF